MFGTVDAAVSLWAHDIKLVLKALHRVTDFRVAIDGGAHLGVWTKFYSEFFDVVHAFEPSDDTFDKLVLNLCGFPNVSCHHRALFDADGHGEVVGKKSWSRRVVLADGESFNLRSLDSFGFASCGLLKLDLEGAELLALHGADTLVRRFKPVIVVEVKGRTAGKYGWKPADLDRWLLAKTYRLLMSNHPNRVYVPA